MAYDPHLAEIRFGTGLSPRQDPAPSAARMLARLSGPDLAAQAFPIEDWPGFQTRLREAAELTEIRKAARTDEALRAAKKEQNLHNKAARKARADWVLQMFLRRAQTPDGLRERLTAFWADHFTVRGKFGIPRRGVAPFAENAIRPHLAGRFADMLIAATTAPMMLHYLDQASSIGPNAPEVKRRGGRAGLNENLAREVMELHTLGVDGPYTQDDVRQLAELLTGLSFTFEGGFVFQPRYAEPGPETVLGQSYGGAEPPQLAEVTAALEDLARHPATARHLARKLAVHFVADDPPEALVADMAARYAETEGQLAEVYAVLLDHPAAWANPLAGNVKQPVDFIGSVLRALDVGAAQMPLGNEKGFNIGFAAPLAQMGQPWEQPNGPDGWPEGDGAWITPQRYAARLQWLTSAPLLLLDEVPDPREVLQTALGPLAPEGLRFAVAAAQTRIEGLSLAFAAPAFQRM
ncbi:DUF1800 domain-containing protein [Pseudooceanicola sp. 200-1SW]|uniref:DUF1800 domain-containing protein n=1 Tax=Pseudooceanicola sp. 200-1SW TaxID=3425949 RepID=UPI003D7F8F4C